MVDLFCEVVQIILKQQQRMLIYSHADVTLNHPKNVYILNLLKRVNPLQLTLNKSQN